MGVMRSPVSPSNKSTKASRKMMTRGMVTSKSKCWKPKVSTTIFSALGSASAAIIELNPFMSRMDITTRGVLKRLCKLGAESKSAP